MDLSDEDANLLLDDSPNGVNEGNATASTSSATPVSTRKLKRQRFSRKNKVVKKSKKSMPQKPILAVPKLLEKSSISEVCQINEVSLKLVKETMKPLYDVDLELEKLQPYPFFRAVDENWVARFTELLDNGEFNYRQSMFTVCKLDEHGRQYLVLDGNHRLNALIQKYGEKCSSCKVYCRVYGVLSKDDIFSLCLDLTKPSLSLELRFLDQIEIVRKFMDEKKIVKTSKVYESHIKLHSLLMENPNECAIEIAQWPDEDYKIIKIFLLAFQDNKIKEHPTARALHYINVTSNGKLPDLKAKNFWNCVIKAVKVHKNYVLNLFTPKEDESFLSLSEIKYKIRNQPQFLERLKSIGILYASLEEASTDLVGEQRTDKQLFDALTSRTYMAHVGRAKQICTLKSVKQKLQHLLKPVCENSCQMSVLDLTLPIFDSLFSTASCIESNEQNFNSSFVADSEPEDEIRKWDFIMLYCNILTQDMVSKSVASLNENSVLILLGDVDIQNVCTQLHCEKPTFQTTIMLQEFSFEVAATEPFNNSLVATFFVFRNGEATLMENGFNSNIEKLPLNKIITPASFEIILINVASFLNFESDKFVVFLPPSSVLDQLYNSFSMFKCASAITFLLFSPEQREKVMSMMQDSEKTSDTSLSSSSLIPLPSPAIESQPDSPFS